MPTKKTSRLLLAAGIVWSVLLAGVATGEDVSDPKTTLDQTIVPVGERELSIGPGESRVTRGMGWKMPGGKVRALAGFKQLSDVHVIDEESPARVEFFDVCDPSFSSAHRPHEAASGHIGASMLAQLEGITKGPATGVNLGRAISTGDNSDNSQKNEVEWFIQLLNGGEIHPYSGDPDKYQGYGPAHTETSWPLDILELAQKPFTSVGTGVPWFGVLGNHDSEVQGNLSLLSASSQQRVAIQAVAKGSHGKLFFNRDTAVEDDRCPEDPNNLSDALGKALGPLLGGAGDKSIAHDENRRMLFHNELLDLYKASPGSNSGHGFKRAPKKDAQLGYQPGYYAFPIGKKIVGISMDTTNLASGSAGSLSASQFKWLNNQMKRNSRVFYNAKGRRKVNKKGTNKLIVLFSHHTSKTLTNPNRGLKWDHVKQDTVKDKNTGEEIPLPKRHCFRVNDAGMGDDGKPRCNPSGGLKELIHRYPNVIAWVNGHEHNNRVDPHPSPKGDKARGFWEINTASHIDWPQQSRLHEIAWKAGKGKKADTLILYSTVVDHMAPTDPDSVDRDGSTQEFLASLARVESYYDACFRVNQADCGAAGAPKDRNVALVMKAPFRLRK